MVCKMPLVHILAQDRHLLLLACKIIHKSNEEAGKGVHWGLEQPGLGGG